MRGDFIGSGWSYPLRVKPNGGISTAHGTDKLEQSMHIILRTYPGERPMRADFGCRLRDFVFGGVTTEATKDIATEVTKALTRWEPRVTVTGVYVVPIREDIGMLHVDIHYRVVETNEERNLVFPFYTIPKDEEE